jgi:hypothetical protein
MAKLRRLGLGMSSVLHLSLATRRKAIMPLKQQATFFASSSDVHAKVTAFQILQTFEICKPEILYIALKTTRKCVTCNIKCTCS